MELLLEIRESDIGENKNGSYPISYNLRKAARAVIFNSNNEIALIKVATEGTHKLPGGGVDDSESIIEALKRECLEEVGAEIEIDNGVGLIIEYRDQFSILQISYCYLAHQIGELHPVQLDQDEVDLGFELMWIPIEKAIALIQDDRPIKYKPKMIVMRDLKFLQKTEEIITTKAFNS